VPGYTIAQINENATNGIFAPRIPAYVSYDINNKRLGVTGSFQFKPDDHRDDAGRAVRLSRGHP
jgi:iron complex outermembrane receptor protein